MAEIRRVRHGGDATLAVVAYRVSERALPTIGQLGPMLLAVPLLALLGIVAGWAGIGGAGLGAFALRRAA